MRITQSHLQLNASHLAQTQETSQTQVAMWVGQRPPAPAATPSTADMAQTTAVALSRAGQEAIARERERQPHHDLPADAQSGSAQTGEVKASDDDAHLDPRLRMLRDMIEMLTGQRIRILRQEDLTSADTVPPPPPGTEGSPAGDSAAPADEPAGFGIDIQSHYRYEESEQTQFSAQGMVRTADGREIQFKIDLSMSRQYVEESSFSFQAGDAVRKDPLVINFGGTAAQLTDQRFSFDLDRDGQQEQMPGLAPGSGWLVFDRNRDGRVNDGSELFGPTTNDGFGELAALDGDGNGWIDEGDAAYQDLRVWQPGSGNQPGNLRSLQEVGVGALSTGQVATPFEQKSATQAPLGATRSTGVWLGEDGRAGTVQQVDVNV